MQKVHEQTLYLTKDKRHLLDENGNIVSARSEKDGKSFYQAIGIESEAFEKVCTQVMPHKVCILWNNTLECKVWDEVDICTKVSLVSTGYSNIS